MKTSKVKFGLALAALAAIVMACNFSATTANISNVKIGKDRNVNQETTTFADSDPIYVVATISNAPGKVKVKGQMIVDSAEGLTAGPFPGLEKTLDLEGSGTATYSFTPPPSGWPKGKYKVDVAMMDDSGAQKDKK